MTIPPLRVPEPGTAASRLALPLSRALFLWYLADVTAQQERANQSVQTRLGELAAAAGQSAAQIQSLMQFQSATQLAMDTLAGQNAELRADYARLAQLTGQLAEARADYERLARLIDQHIVPTLEKLDGRLSDAESLQTELSAAFAQQDAPTQAE